MAVATTVTKILHGKKHASKLKFVPLSNDTARKRIREISNDTRKQLPEKTEVTKSAVQPDESTDISNSGQLLTCYRFQNPFHENYCCQPL
jgi:hypothetical protein